MTETAALRVLIAGGGVAGLEALLTLHAEAARRCELTLLAPESDFRYRPMAVAESFSRGQVRRYPLAAIARDTGARLVEGGLAAVDDAARVATTDDGTELEYDALMLATGARSEPAYRHALTWDDRAEADRLGGLLRDIDEGYTHRLAFVIPPGPGWPLPAYELALLVGRHAYGMSADVEVTLVTPEPAPLAAFGAQASEAVAAELREVGIRFEGDARAEVEHGHATTLHLRPSERRLEVDRAVALPRLVARVPTGVPAGNEGFVPVDEQCKVSGLQRVWAAGDCIAFPIKFGGLAAEQADAAAEAIAALAGADVSPQPFRPVLRGKLLTGRDPRYLRHDPEGGGGEDSVADHALWWPPGKIAGRRLAPYLSARDEAAVAGPAPRPAGVAVQIDLHREVGPPGES